MTRINRPDTLFTELRELRRRLRLVEATSTTRPAAAAALAAQPTSAVPLVSARPADWPSTESAEWEPLLMVTGSVGGLQLRVSVDEDTEGTVRVSVDGVVVGEESPVSAEVTRLEVPVERGGEVLVEARRNAGDGAVRVIGWLTG